MTAVAQRLRLRCFIEGVEVPIIAAQVEARPNSPVAASIQIPPLAEGTRLLPRSLVHVFFLDFYGTSHPHATMKGQKSDSKAIANPSALEQEVADLSAPAEGVVKDYSNVHYKLLFVGEVMGFQWTKTPMNRSLVLQCMDLSNYWDYAYQFNNTDIFGPGIKAMFSGGSTNLFTDFLTDEGQVLLQLIRKNTKQGLLSGIIKILESIGGTYYTDKKISGQNTFFSLAELRLHVTQMITAYDKDPTAKNLINADGYDGLFGRTLGGLGSQVSFRQAINALQAMIFHETFGQPCPLYVPGSFGAINGQRRMNLTDYPDAAFVLDAAKKLIETCNSIVSNLNDASAGNLNNTAKNKRKEVKDFILSQPRSAAQKCTEVLNQLGTKKDAKLEATKTFFATGKTLLLQVVTKLAKWTGGPLDVKTVTAAITSVQQAKAKFERVSQLQIVLSNKGESIPARLNQQIFRPDIWFAPPPRCNVLFPDHYTQLSYMRSFMAEPTRLMLKTNSEFFGEDILFDNFFFAPKSLTAAQDKANLKQMLKNELLDHELFTGILPVFEKMGELNIFAAQSGLEKDGKTLKPGLAQRSTNFLYFKYRFAARQMSVECRFNPYIACGFPGLIIDKYVDLQAIERHNSLLASLGKNARELKNALGTHFLGNFTEVTHSIDQGRGVTTINVGYARQYEEGVEFLGAVEQEQKVRQRFNTDAKRKTVVAALNAPGAGSLGPNYGTVIRSLDMTEAYRARGVKDGPFFPLYRGPRRHPGDEQINVPCGITALARDYDKSITDFIGDPNQVVTFKALEIEEEIPRYRTEIVELPAEEYIRPGWYGPCWKPNEIGQVYDFFFKTGSITDPTQVGDPQGAFTPGTQDKTDDALLAAFENRTRSTNNVSILTLDDKATTQQAVQFLVLTYSYMKQAGDINIDDFIKAYTWRPIASMVDMFGTTNLTLSTDGLRVLSGFEGFHSRSFGPYEDLFGLVSPEIENILGVKRGETAAQKLDTRKRKQEAVLDYVTALNLSRSVVG